MTADRVRTWLDAGELDLPLPGRGDTLTRWTSLAALTEIDVTAGRLAEAHVDATAILADLDGEPPTGGQLWGVWAAETPDAVVTARHGHGIALEGLKAWCSGAGLCTHALVTARRGDGARGLYAVDLASPGVGVEPSSWQNAGMLGSDTRSVRFQNATAVPIGGPGAYLSRAGFWHGAVGVAACWLGGARAVAGPLYRAVGDPAAPASADPHAQAHLGAVDAVVAAAEATLALAARTIDSDPDDPGAELIARRVRAVVEHAVDEAITRTGRALGPGPLALDGTHARRVADLTMYVRQSHAERDLAALGRLAAR
ncbi:MAG: acyl-CoA dehydrogenase [Actinomycetota bacterium]|nr:acyl-CoA dehydrogenase [Actinomycetota bacterium]